MGRFIFYVTLLLGFFSCEPSGNNTITPDFPILLLDQQLSEISTKEVIGSKKNQEYAMILTKKAQHWHATIHSNSLLFSKKVFNLFPINSQQKQKTFENHIYFQKIMKTSGLIGLKSKFITVQGKDEQQEMFFQEGFDKYILESNRNREGAIYVFNDSLSCVFNSGVKSNKIAVSTNVFDFIQNEINVYEVFDIQKTSMFFALIEYWNQEELLKHIAWYLNPISQLLEPFVCMQEESGDYQLINTLKSNNLVQLMSAQILKKYKKQEVISKEDMHMFFLQNIDMQNSKIQTDSIYYKYFKRIGTEHIELKHKYTQISDVVIIPNYHNVIIPEGSEIDIIKGGAIISFASMQCNGTIDSPIHFISSDYSSMGVHVINGHFTSHIENVIFDGLNSLEKNNWKMPSAVTFYESPVKIKNSVFKSSLSEDALNVFRSGFSIDNCLFENTFSDAFDADFSDGNIKNSTFINIGNDGVDLSGSNVDIDSCIFTNIGDKGISGGEKSKVKSKNIIISNAEIAITSKDKSYVEITNSKMQNINLVFCVFEKKKEFGASKIVVNNVCIDSCRVKYLLEQKSSLYIDNVLQDLFSENVKKQLYGKEFGKKTVK